MIYAAKSTEDARGSIVTQLADCRALAEHEDWSVVGEYQDEAASAYKGNRGEGLAAAKRLAEQMVVDRGDCVLAVQHSDRMARGDGVKADHLVEIALWARRAGVRITSVQDPTTFAGGLAFAAMMGDRNHEDSRSKGLAVAAGLQRTFERGQRLGGPVPDGYRLLKDFGAGDQVRRSYVPDPDRAAIIRLIFELSGDGMGDPSIARELNRRGYRTRGGIAWTRRRVQDTLTNPFYAGRVVIHRGKPEQSITDGDHPALVEQSTFDRLTVLRATRDRAKGSDRSPRGRPTSKYALARLARCGECGEPMRPITSPYRRRDGSQRRTYLCAHVKDATGLCSAPPVDAEIVDAAVVSQLQSYLGDFDTWRARIESDHHVERVRLEREVQRAADALKKGELAAERIEAKWQEYVAAGRDADAELVLPVIARVRGDTARSRARLAATQAAINDLPADAPADAMLDFYNALRAAVKGRLEGAGALAQVNLALRDLFDRFELTTTANGVELLPVLDTAAAARIVLEVKTWPHGWRWNASPERLAQYPDRPEYAVLLDLTIRGSEGPKVLPKDPPPTLAHTGASVVPPLRPIAAPLRETTNAHE